MNKSINLEHVAQLLHNLHTYSVDVPSGEEIEQWCIKIGFCN